LIVEGFLVLDYFECHKLSPHAIPCPDDLPKGALAERLLQLVLVLKYIAPLEDIVPIFILLGKVDLAKVTTA